MLVQSGYKLLAPTQSRRSSGDRAAGGGSRINKEEEKKVDTGSNFSMLDSRLLGLSYFQLSSFKLYFLQHFLIPASESVVSTEGALVVVTV